jgi:hypothetical protein
MMRKKSILLAALALSLLCAGVALAAGSPSIDWWVIGSGGGSTTVGNTSLDSTIGQWLVGSDESGNLQLGPGFWGGGWDKGYRVFLPVVWRGVP